MNWKQKFDDSHKSSDQLHKELEQKDKEINKLKKNNKVLQDQCTQIDRQAEQFKNKYQGLGRLKDKWTEEKDSTLTEVQKLNKQIERLQTQLMFAVNEKESALQTIDSQRVQYEERESTHKQKLLDLEQTLNEVLQKNHEYEEQLTRQEDNFYSKDQLILSLDQKISVYEEELIAIKEEAAKHITTIGELRESNHRMTDAFQESMEKIDELQTRIDSLHNQLEIREEEMSRERIANHETIGQQLKLIDFLQKKAETLEKQKKVKK